MPVLEDIISTLNDNAAVKEVRIGPFWTAVVSKKCGLASSMFTHGHHLRVPVPGAGRLTGKTVRELVQEANSESDMMRCIACSALNSILQVDMDRCVEINAESVLMKKAPNKRAVIVGHFPFVEKIRQVASSLWVLEKHPIEGDEPAEKASELIPQADVVAITGTALLNGTMDDLLSYCNKSSFVMVLGPSTPISPVWFDYGVDMVLGSVVTNVEGALRKISEGAIFRQLKDCVRLLAIER
jgi:hypothetical protein